MQFQEETLDEEDDNISISIYIIYYICAASTATRPITDTAQCNYK
jgi:hypothetical protein